jgi:hypothetical protein
MGEKPGIAMSLNNLGIVALEQKEYSAARGHFAESLSLAQEIGDQLMVVYDLVGLAAVAVQCGPDDAQRAAHLASAAEAHSTFMGASMEPIIRRLCDGTIETAKAFLGEESFEAAWADGKAAPLEQTIAFALDNAHTD